ACARSGFASEKNCGKGPAERTLADRELPEIDVPDLRCLDGCDLRQWRPRFKPPRQPVERRFAATGDDFHTAVRHVVRITGKPQLACFLARAVTEKHALHPPGYTKPAAFCLNRSGHTGTRGGHSSRAGFSVRASASSAFSLA